MSRTSSDSSLESALSSDERSSANESSKKPAAIEPGPVEKQIEEYLKNWDPISRFMKETPAEAEDYDKRSTEDQGTSGDQEQTTGVDEVKEKSMTSEEAAFMQFYQNPFIWHGNVPVSQMQHVTKFGAENTSPVFPNTTNMNPIMGSQLYPWPFGTIPINSAHPETYQIQNILSQQQCQESNQNGNPSIESLRPYVVKTITTIDAPYFECQDESSCTNLNVEQQSSAKANNSQEYENKLASLKEELEEVTKENEELKAQLEEQRSNLDNLGPRYKYLEENFEEFIHMKDEYLRLRNERRKELGLKETYNKLVQTWSTAVMCDNCIRTHELLGNPQIKSLIGVQENEAFCVSRSELSELEEKFEALKENISEREKDYENREEKVELIHLTALNVGYRSRIIELEAKNKQVLQWAAALQKIVAKIYSEENARTLTTKEEKWVERILHKYANIKNV